MGDHDYFLWSTLDLKTDVEAEFLGRGAQRAQVVVDDWGV